MCNNCIHQPVCAKYTATGGHVRECEHFKEERRGKWKHIHIVTSTEYFTVATCSVCGNREGLYINGRNPWYNFCPNCGADMRPTEGKNV